MNKIIIFFKKNIKKEHLILLGIGLVLIMSGLLSWNLFFSKYYIFSKQEKYFLEIVKDYYQYHSIYLPKEGNIKTITLEELYEMGRIDTLHSPKSHKLCDTNSWVKVYNDGNKYHYSVYLKCEKFETNIDHEGPIITLKGDSTVYVSLNKEYEELGVEKVVDNVDGNIEITKVVIDNSKVNIKKVGQYNVTYTVRDTLNNETVVTRKVIVSRNLTDIVKDATNDSNYYQGRVENNYLLFSGMMYRIINVNEDGTITLISNEILNNLRADYENYENSNIDQYLNKEYLNIIHDQSYLVDTEFCVDNTDSIEKFNGQCSNTLKRKVAILDVNTFKNSFLNNSSYLCSYTSYTLSGKVNDKLINVYAMDDNCMTMVEDTILTPIKPVITLKSDLMIMSGDGTVTNPYKLADYDYGKQQDKINTRLIGEYVNYSGTSYRIMDIDKNDNVVLISVGPLDKNVSNMIESQVLSTTVPKDKKFIFNLQDVDNPGYILNNNFIDYVNDSYIVKSEYDIPTNISGKKYNEYSTKKVSAKLSIPKTYDLFSGKKITAIGYLYLYIDESENENNVFYMDMRNGRVYDDVKNTSLYCMKVVMTVKGDLLIKSGKGTENSPYYIR